MITQTRNPQFSVRVVSLQHGEIPQEVLRDSVQQITVHRRMGQAAGSFQVHLLPRPVSALGFGAPSSWRDLLSMGDFIEISVWVPPRPPTVVMRGFLDVVEDSFSIEGGTPQRSIVIAGRDFGKILLLTKLYYLDAQTQQSFIFDRWKQAFYNLFAWKGGQLPNPEHTPLARNVETDLPAWKPLDLLNNIWDAFYIPQQEALLRQLPGVSGMSFVAAEEALLEAGEQGLRVFAPTALPLNWAPFMDVWALMRMYQHAPWREIFVDDYAGPTLIYRPTPWLDFHGNFIYRTYEGSDPTGTLVTRDLDEDHIVSYSLTRNDEMTRNFFFTYPDRFGFYPQMMKTYGGKLEGVFEDPFKGNPYLVGFQASDESGTKRSDFNLFGFRLDERRTPYLDFDHGMSEQQIASHLTDVRQQGLKANKELARAFDHNAVLEFGTIQIPGDERIHIGNYLRLNEGKRLKLGNGARYYVEGVSHMLRVGSRNDGLFRTSLEVSRGRGHLIRTGVVTQ